MANWSDLKAAVASIVKTNGNKEITGQLLQNVLNNIISNVGLNSSFAGIATPETNPGTPDGNVFYLATTEGTYSNFNGIVINSGEAVILEWKGSWVKKESGFATKEKLSELEENTNQKLSELGSVVGKYKGTYIGDTTIFTKDDIPAGLAIKVLLRLNTTSGGVFIVDADGNELERFAIFGKDEGVIQEWSNYTLPSNYDRVVNVGGYSGKWGVDVEISVVGANNAILKKEIETNKNNTNTRLQDFKYIILNKETDSKSGKYVDNQYNCCTPKVAVKEGDILTTTLPIYTIAKYGKDGAFIGENVDVRFSNEYLVEQNTSYIVLVFRNANASVEISKNGNKLLLADVLLSIESQTPSDSIKGITLNGKEAEKEDGIIDIPNASYSKSGLLSPNDKQKLDTLQIGDIKISGSGIMKNASAFGFLPSNDGITNAENLQQCLNGGGTIVIDIPGVYLISRTLLVDSNTTILIGNNVIFKKAKGTDGVFGRHTFLNRGALSKSYNENITIKGLNLVTNSLGAGTDIQQIFGLRGEVAMFYIKNLHIDGFTCLDGDAFNYNIHVCTFEDILIENVHIEGLKDGIHLGRGRKFVIRHCKFATNDDAIAINAHDYPGSNAEIGDLEDGIVEDITYLKAPSSYAKARGALMIVGSWSDWKSGNKYIPNGDTVVSNGRIYMTYGERSTTEMVSTIRPTHEVGVETYADGVTWVMKQENVAYSANVRRVNFYNIYCYRNSSMLFPFYLENDAYVRCYYPNSVPPTIEDISISNVHIPNDVVVDSFAKFFCPFKNLIIRDSDWSDDGLCFASGQAGNTDALVPVENYECNLLTMGIKVKNTNFARFVGDSNWNVRAKILGTIHSSEVKPVINGSGMTLLQNDL